jgi:thiamine-phosphate pyrophosphorylase
VTASGAALPRYVLVSDLGQIAEDELVLRVQRAREPVVVLVRDKGLPREQRRALALRLTAVARPLGHSVWIADDVGLASELDLDGVHLVSTVALDAVARARKEAPRAWVNVACHSVEEALSRVSGPLIGAQGRPDSVFLSPIFASPGKGLPLGVAAISALVARLTAAEPPGAATKVIALGGIDRETAPSCFQAGAAAVASIRAELG